MIVDFHTHTFPDAIAAPTLRKLSGKSHTPPFTDGTAAGLAASATAAGIDRCVILPVATSPRQVPRIQEAAAERNRSQGKQGCLFSVGCAHPDDPDWRANLERAAELGLKGIKVHPVYQGVYLDDPRYLRILTRAGELGLFVVTHSGGDIGYPGREECMPEVIRRAVQRSGPVTLIAAHMGGWKRWRQAEELLAEFPRVYLDTSFSVGRLIPSEEGYYTREELELLNETQFLNMVRAFGAKRVLFGTDSPWSDQKESLQWMQNLPLSQEERALILGENAWRILKG